MSEEEAEDCDTCGGTGQLCTECKNQEDACICDDGPDLDDCDDCLGTGVVSDG